MRFSYAESMIEPALYAPLAKEAEALGFDTMVVPDSIMYPEDSDSTYPYNADGTREFLEGKPFIEPFTLIPSLAAVTERLRFTTFVVKLPGAASGDRCQAGHLGRRHHGWTFWLRGRDEPVVRGLPRHGLELGTVAVPAWTK